MKVGRTHETVMTGRMMFRVVVAEVRAAGLPLDKELLLLGPILDPVEAHVDGL